MKTYILILASAVVSFITLESFTNGFGKRDGTEPGFTGSPGDSLKNCTVCHGGKSVNVEGWITSNIPATGYIPGQRYTITATNTREGHTRFGFSVSPQAINGDLLGTIIITDTTTTKTVGNEKYVTYRADGVPGFDLRSWSFDWIAPTADVVVFYGAFNSNYEGHKGGDETQLSQLRVYKQGITAVKEVTQQSPVLIYPNPIASNAFVQLHNSNEQITSIHITTLAGQQAMVITSYMPNQAIPFDGLPKGTYLVLVQTNAGNTYIQKVIKL
jgi:hypothetical protein